MPIALVHRPRATILRPNASSSQAPYTTKRLSLATLTKKEKPMAPKAARSFPNRCQFFQKPIETLRVPVSFPSSGNKILKATIPNRPKPPRVKKGDRQPNRSIRRPSRGIPTSVLPAQLNSRNPMASPRLL